MQAIDDAGVLIETDGGSVRRLPAAYVAEHVEYAYALTGHAMQGGTVERAFVLAAPHELTKGWSYTALSRARGDTRLFVLTDGQDRERDELAPGERRSALTEKEAYSRLARYMRLRDDEDLAIEQLPTASVASGCDSLPRRGEEVEQATDVASERVEAPTTIEAVRTAAEHLASLRAQLEALASPEVRRLEAAERRAGELVARRAELLQRVRNMAPAPRLPFATDRHAAERENLRSALAGLDAELHGVRAVHQRLATEIGQPEQIRAERVALEQAIARASAERDILLNHLVAQEIASTPAWATTALGERPTARGDRTLWERAARGLARYRIENDVDEGRSALGEPPTDPARADRHRQARATLERVRFDLGLETFKREVAEPPALPADYARLFGEDRAKELEKALAAARGAARALTDGELDRLASELPSAAADLDRQAAAHAVRLEREHAHHQEVARKQTGRAAELEAQADKLGRRARSDRQRLRHDAALQRRHAARHAADAGRTELELQRLREAGRHPVQWLTDHGQELAERRAARAELDRRRELDIQGKVDRGLTDPPAHLRELIGDPPTSGERLAQEWRHLAEEIERHRLTHSVDIDRARPLRPDIAEIERDRRGVYSQVPQPLADRIDRYRNEHDRPELEMEREESGGRSPSLGREL